MSLPPEEFPGVHPAFPVNARGSIQSEFNGMTKSEYVSMHLLSGLLAGRRAPSAKAFGKLAAEAIKHADELIRLHAEKVT